MYKLQLFAIYYWHPSIISKIVALKNENIVDFIYGNKCATDFVFQANAAYFKGLWQSQFSPELTRKEVFYVSRSKHTLVDMMKQKGTFNHSKQF
jgi:serine protease inhibitor